LLLFWWQALTKVAVAVSHLCVPKKDAIAISDKSHVSTPLLSIVTVVRNAETVLPETIESVCKQKFRNFEYVVVDGASTDGTLHLINQHKDSITTFLSEPDKGIYDAMNKAIDLAKGEWIYFLNAGDNLMDGDTLEKVFAHAHQEYDLLYGKVRTKNEPTGVNYEFGRELTLKSFYHNIPISHQGVFFRKSMFAQLGKYNLNYRILADQEWMVRFFKQSHYRALHLKQVIAEYETVGFSYTNRLKSLKETVRYGKEHFPVHITLLNYLYYPFMVIKVRLIALLKSTGLFKVYRRWRFSA
jgi:glycosyltransferase involved in cell wall biosynthesis